MTTVAGVAQQGQYNNFGGYGYQGSKGAPERVGESTSGGTQVLIRIPTGGQGQPSTSRPDPQARANSVSPKVGYD